MKARIPQNMQGGPQNMNQMIRQAQKMQEDMAAFQEEFASREFRSASGGGAVEVVMNGNRELLNVHIKPEVIDSDDTEMLEDLIVSAVNETIRSIDEESAEGMGKITGGMNMPGLF